MGVYRMHYPSRVVLFRGFDQGLMAESLVKNDKRQTDEKNASSLFCMGRLNRGGYLHTNSVTPTATGASFGGGGVHRMEGYGGGQPP